jgi:hypothetical protein
MPKELALNELAGNGSAIHWNKLPALRAGRTIVQGSGHQLFSSPTLANDECGGIGWRNPLNQLLQA